MDHGNLNDLLVQKLVLHNTVTQPANNIGKIELEVTSQQYMPTLLHLTLQLDIHPTHR